MNAVSNSTTEFMEESGNGSDSDTNPDETPEYYQPISAVEDEDSDQVSSDEDRASDFHRLPNEISSLEINGDDVEEDSSEDEVEDEEERNSGGFGFGGSESFQRGRESKECACCCLRMRRELWKQCVEFRSVESLLIGLVRFP
uniref:Uncharacterized protein n=1 Tax=Fagus sylvatica TaxID=28930 RepID=A0A2N9FHS6_FAGSY